MKECIEKYRKWMEAGAGKVARDLGLLIGRVSFGGMMLLSHGWPKLSNYGALSGKFPDPIGVGSAISLTLAVFAEFFCSALIIIGIGTRMAAIPLIATMSVAAFIFHSGDPFFAPAGETSKEFALVYLTAFLLIFLAGPGRYSADALILGKERKMT